ncbi:MAG: DJ-1/PfpI family protein, partial [Burkholderiaceae bacterium]
MQAQEIGILIYPGAQLAAVHGLTDVFLIANRLAAPLGGGTVPELRVSHWRATANGKQVSPVFDTHPQLASAPAILIIPPSLEDALAPAVTAALAEQLRNWHAAGATLCSICVGAFLLAETGLLDGRTATTHWRQAAAFAARYPRVTVDADRLVIDDGDIITAGGLMAWTDLGLKLVDRFLGSSVMLQTARVLLVDPAGREQRHYSHFSP